MKVLVVESRGECLKIKKNDWDVFGVLKTAVLPLNYIPLKTLLSESSITT